MIPKATVAELGLAQSAAIRATLADGSEIVLESFDCVVDWFGKSLKVGAIANEGRFPLLGIGLLRDRKLLIDYAALTLVVE